MFQFPGSASPLREMIGLATDRVSPFGNPGITACLQLPQAYRSLPRPSSPPCAKASTVRPYARSEEHTSELQSQSNLVCRLLLEKKKYYNILMLISLLTTTLIT